MDEHDRGGVRRLPVLPAHHGLHVEDWTRLALQLGHAECSQHHQVEQTHTHTHTTVFFIRLKVISWRLYLTLT